jgi:hypothetical protein
MTDRFVETLSECKPQAGTNKWNTAKKTASFALIVFNLKFFNLNVLNTFIENPLS